MRLGVLDGQLPRLYGGTILRGGVTDLRGSSGPSKIKVVFFDTFVTS